jgi:hypothetical protein
MEHRAAIKFCVKLKKTATETFEMLRSAYGEERLSRTSRFEWQYTYLVYSYVSCLACDTAAMP